MCYFYSFFKYLIKISIHLLFVLFLSPPAIRKKYFIRQINMVAHKTCLLHSVFSLPQYKVKLRTRCQPLPSICHEPISIRLQNNLNRPKTTTIHMNWLRLLQIRHQNQVMRIIHREPGIQQIVAMV